MLPDCDCGALHKEEALSCTSVTVDTLCKNIVIHFPISRRGKNNVHKKPIPLNANTQDWTGQHLLAGYL